MKQVSSEQLEVLAFKIDDEGFDYAINNYGDEIEDGTYLQLLEKYQSAKSDLKEHVKKLFNSAGIECDNINY